LKLDDEGLYACEVSPFNDAPALKHVAHIRTLIRPERVQINDRLPSNETTVVTMRYDEATHHINCRVDGARPAAQIKWIKTNGDEYPATTRTFTQGNCYPLTMYSLFMFDEDRRMKVTRRKRKSHQSLTLSDYFSLHFFVSHRCPFLVLFL
jgi:hypothetical protein